MIRVFTFSMQCEELPLPQGTERFDLPLPDYISDKACSQLT